ncbi:outer membrane protein assembly factor BamE domain-containing protein [Phenylobacterium sp.]|uniref:outer membrane protein assembly factor BamE domain-containing protein n=1 Tax=Phenylobacterium sp. TaxID=1871053 RepID=UPI0040357E04
MIVSVLALAACDRGAFEAAAWRDADFSTRDRVRMAPDLIASGRIDGLDRAGVVELLGEPTATDKFANSDLVYLLGRERGLMAIDRQWLLIELDRNGRVAAYRIVED